MTGDGLQDGAMASGLRQRAKEKQLAARGNRILDALATLITRWGYGKTTVDDIAREAGVGVGTVYRHFPNKEALLVALMREKFRLFAARGREALALDGEPFELLAELLRRNAETAAGDAGVQHALAGVGESIWLQAAAEQDDLMAVTEQLLVRARRAGTIRPDIGPLDIGMLMCGVCSTMGEKPGFDWRRHLELSIDMLRAP